MENSPSLTARLQRTQRRDLPKSQVGARGRAHRQAATCAVLSLMALTGGGARAYGADFASSSSRSEEARPRAAWAALLAGYIALGALATGGAYLLRDNVAGRSVAVTAAGWGGLGVGAGLGYGLVQLQGCGAVDCSAESDVASAVGGMLVGLAASIAGYLVTSDGGMSRPYTTVAGLAPAFLLLSIGTITGW